LTKTKKKHMKARQNHDPKGKKPCFGGGGEGRDDPRKGVGGGIGEEVLGGPCGSMGKGRVGVPVRLKGSAGRAGEGNTNATEKMRGSKTSAWGDLLRKGNHEGETLTFRNSGSIRGGPDIIVFGGG